MRPQKAAAPLLSIPNWTDCWLVVVVNDGSEQLSY